ncbi:MAG: NADH-ubiquinone oxidoreductase-F iron-sulfur binding region domain-containing protein [Ignavibacteria bacterium]
MNPADNVLLSREGCGWMLKVLNRIMTAKERMSDSDLLISIAENIEGNTICALGDAKRTPVKWAVRKFRRLEAKINPIRLSNFRC